MDCGPHPLLERSLDSVVAATVGNADRARVRAELLVGVDGPALRVRDHVASWTRAHPDVDTRIECFEKSSQTTYGNRQRNAFLDQGPRGRLIAWQDQDDCFYPYALARVCELAKKCPGQPMIFKMCVYKDDGSKVLLWRTRGQIDLGYVGGHMLVVPNEPRLLARWTPETSYAADFTFIEETLKRFAAEGRQPVWFADVISRVRPDAAFRGAK